MQLLVLMLGLSLAGCATKKSAKAAVADGSPTSASTKPVVKPSNMMTGKVVSFNGVGRFAVLNFPITHMPAIDQAMFLYRDGLKIGEVKITGPQKDDNIVADLVKGEAKAGDEVRDR